MDSFVVKISKQATPVDYEALASEEKRELLKGIEYHPNQHRLYRFNVAPHIKTGRISKKQQKKQAYSKTDRVLIQLREFTGVELIGIYPVDESKSTSKESEIGGEGSVSLFNVVTLKLSGKTKDEIAKQNPILNSGFTDSFAQWVFYKPYIQAHQDFMLFIACTTSGKDQASILCDVSVQERGRNLCRPISRRIPLPK